MPPSFPLPGRGGALGCSVRLRIRHTTQYSYAEKVRFSSHTFVLRPREDHHLRVTRFDLRLMPSGRLRWVRDMHENFIGLALPEGESRQLAVLMETEVEVTHDNPFDFLLAPHALRLPFDYTAGERAALAPYLEPGPDDGVDAWITRVCGGRPEGDTVQALTALNTALFKNLAYVRRDDIGIQTPAETLALGTASCRDFAVLLIAACRRLGIAARFVSGYLHTPEGGPGRADGAMHAWAEAYLPGAGWKGLDPTNGIFCTNDFIPVAVALDPASVSPIQGSYLSGHPVENHLEARVEVTRLD